MHLMFQIISGWVWFFSRMQHQKFYKWYQKTHWLSDEGNEAKFEIFFFFLIMIILLLFPSPANQIRRYDTSFSQFLCFLDQKWAILRYAKPAVV